ncbi:MAG: D-glycero-beta-D-manno-heptose-7-phosphate kinase [Bacteroidales bacterium]|jgi:rfaE bifunctional protein kinase chain/domain|nr:bifunctional ADP-heptose synthase [Bacteroidales bacterium]MCK9498836.1 bifunctional ADP-heptose synthase [Bacteroidales bacterium]MDY0315632.1 PfkB family carbohydrate kinase [Bacteroidales bacterium]NLB85866.1 D-glycero-beta-D-manno-heptose-7-phosphate kinase [Bacteroidales bacterium]
MEISKTQILSYFEKFKTKRVLIIGDVMIDSYMWGSVKRISPEAPIPIVSISSREYRMGGAANVALNIKSLGAEPILCSVLGQDEKGKIFTELLEQNSMSSEGLLYLEDRKTTTKTRVISSSQHLLRVDDELDTEIDKKSSDLLFKKVEEIIEKQKIDLIIFEDYDKGVLSAELISKIVEIAKQKSIFTAVDPKKRNFNSYNGVDLFKPNFKEFCEGTKSEISKTDFLEIKKSAKAFLKTYSIKTLLLTLSEYGVFISDNKNEFHFPAVKRLISDVSGAGDTVISVAGLLLSSGASMAEIAKISNIAGGLVCEKSGVVPIEIDELQAEF